MDSESVGLVSIAIGLLLVIGVVRGTWQKLFADVGLGSSGSGGLAPMPDTANPPGASGGFVLCQTPSGTFVATPNDCQALGGTNVGPAPSGGPGTPALPQGYTTNGTNPAYTFGA